MNWGLAKNLEEIFAKYVVDTNTNRLTLVYIITEKLRIAPKKTQECDNPIQNIAHLLRCPNEKKMGRLKIVDKFINISVDKNWEI